MTRFLVCVVSVACGLGVSARVSDARSAGACPGVDRAAAVSARPGATRTLVPTGAGELLLCRYSGLDAPGGAFRLQVQRLVSQQPTVAVLTSELDALTPTTGIYHCPSERAADIVARFIYAAGPQNPVTVDLTGRNAVTNGHVHREAGTSAAGRRLIGALTRLTTRSAG